MKAGIVVLAIASGALALAACNVFDPAVGPVRDAGGPVCVPPPEEDAGEYGSSAPASGDDAENYCVTDS